LCCACAWCGVVRTTHVELSSAVALRRARLFSDFGFRAVSWVTGRGAGAGRGWRGMGMSVCKAVATWQAVPCVLDLTLWCQAVHQQNHQGVQLKALLSRPRFRTKRPHTSNPLKSLSKQTNASQLFPAGITDCPAQNLSDAVPDRPLKHLVNHQRTQSNSFAAAHCQLRMLRSARACCADQGHRAGQRHQPWAVPACRTVPVRSQVVKQQLGVADTRARAPDAAHIAGTHPAARCLDASRAIAGSAVARLCQRHHQQ
jgi:hypothetical protein